MTDPGNGLPSESHPALIKPAGPTLGVSPPRGVPVSRRGMFSSLKHVRFRRYWGGLFLSNIGSWMQTVAQGWLVLRLSDSAFVLGLVTFAGSLPTLVFAPIAGVAADRSDRRSVLLAMQSVQMGSALLLAAATFWGFVTVPLVAALAITSGVAGAFMTPSHQSLFLDLVGAENLMNAIALNSMQFNLSRIIGPMIAGFTIAAVGETGCFLLNAVSFVAILVPLALLPPMRSARRPTRGAWVDLRIGLRFARRDAVLPPLLALSVALALFGTPAVTLAPLYARRLLGVGPQGLGGMLSAVGIGAVAMALLLAWLGDFERKGLAVTRAAWAFALSLAGLAVSRRYAFSLASLALLGGAMMCSSSLVNTIMQKRAPALLRGRVISLYALAWLGFVPLGNLQAGAVAQRFGAAASLWAGVGGIALTLLAIRLLRPIPAHAA